jgi:NAD(P)-dependent dehydrogenase (short-subunit alcohol dehydrogenase family)
MFDYNPSPDLLTDRVIAITGAGDGIGRSAALACARHGATVILIGRTTAKLEAVYDEIELAGYPQAAIFPMDLLTATEQDYENLANAAEKEFGKLHGLLHNAALLGGISPLQSVSMKTFQDVMQVNVNAAFALTRYLLPLLLNAEDASVIFTSSTVGREARAFWGPYAVSKAADEMLVQVLQLELENTSKVRVNSVNPGATATSMRKQAFPAENPATLPSADDIMPVYLYLLGPDSKEVKGQQLNAR